MQLSEEGHSVVVVDKNRDAFRRLHHFHGKTIVGSGFDRDVLFQADARRANALAAVTSGDNTNILCARIARDNYEIKNVVARIYDPARADIYMKLGIPTVATSLWTTQQVKRWLLPADDSVEWTASSGTLHLVERIVPDVLAGKPLSYYDHGDNVRVIGVDPRRSGPCEHRRSLRPRGRRARVPRDDRGTRRVEVAHRRRPTMRVMIAGGGSVGVSIALDLVDRHHDVTLLEQVSTTAERLKAMLPGVNVDGGGRVRVREPRRGRPAQRRRRHRRDG